MKKLMLFACAVLLAAASLATPGTAVAGDTCAVVKEDPGAMSDQEREDWLRQKGLQIAGALPAQPPLCPTTTNCPLACPVGSPCALSILGQCCTTAGGPTVCCLPSKKIVVQTCPCTGCPGVTQVSWSCI